MAEEELDLVMLKRMAADAGLPLSETDAAAVLKGVQRNREMAASLRALIAPVEEPVPVFRPG